jgi:hypothetical protein
MNDFDVGSRTGFTSFEKELNWSRIRCHIRRIRRIWLHLTSTKKCFKDVGDYGIAEPSVVILWKISLSKGKKSYYISHQMKEFQTRIEPFNACQIGIADW